MTQSLRLIDALINRGISLPKFLKMMLFLVPDLVVIILPISLVIGTLFTFSRLYADRELVVLRTLGLSNFQLSKAPFLLSGCVILILYGLNFYVMPIAFQKFKDTEYELRHKIGSMILTPGDFTTFKGLTAYVRDRRPNGALYGILIHDERGEKPLTLLAEKGVLKENFSGLQLTLFEGTRQEINQKTGEPSVLSFKSYSLDLTTDNLARPERARKPYERSLKELLSPSEPHNSETFQKKLTVELHQRLLMPLNSFVFILVLMVFFLRGDYDRRGRSKRILFSVGCCLVLELGIFGLLNLGQQSLFFIGLAYFIVLGVSLFCLWFLGLKKRFSAQAINPKKGALI